MQRWSRCLLDLWLACVKCRLSRMITQMFFPCARLHASHYYPLPFAVLQPVLMSTGHTPMYTSAVSTLVRAQWRMPPQQCRHPSSLSGVVSPFAAFAVFAVAPSSAFLITVCSVLFFPFFFIADAKVGGHRGISVFLLIVIQKLFCLTVPRTHPLWI